jgi:hypothetical protein
MKMVERKERKGKRKRKKKKKKFKANLESFLRALTIPFFSY